jgi:hypothetical protein
MAAGMHVGAWITCFPADGRVRGLEMATPAEG